MKNDRQVSLSFVRSNKVRSGWVAVSTVLLPEGFGRGCDYETMVFEAKRGGGKVKSWLDLDCRRYDTRSEAAQGHGAVVTEWESRKPNRVPPPSPAPRIVVKSRAA